MDKIESFCPECGKPGYQTDDTGAYWSCKNDHSWADITWIYRDDEYEGDP